MTNCLVLITGIGEAAYGFKSLRESVMWKHIEARYSDVVEIRYQPIMDKYAVVGKSLLDPLRLMFTPQGWEAEEHIRKRLHQIRGTYNEVDVLTHSLASWMIYKMDVRFENMYVVASPIGWCTAVSRWAVRVNIGTPKVSCKKLIYLYSKKDPVSMFPTRIGKYLVGDKNHTFETGTSHNLDEYLDYMSHLGYDVLI